jgi:tetratricopeptide (TPR) repeat protein
MKKLFISLLLAAFTAMVANAQTSLTDQAAAAYQQGDYSQAIALYEQVAKQEGTSAELFYNLGNAYFKDRQYPAAILNYERALLKNPGMSDAKANLALAQLQITDKITPTEEFFLTAWTHTLRDKLSSNDWGWLGASTFILFICGLLLYIFVRKLWLRKLGFFGGVVCLVLCIVANVFSYQQMQRHEAHAYAIVFTPTVTVKSTPAESGTDLFVIHDGTKVRIRSTLGEWSEIALADGNVGWLPTKDIEKI